MMRYLFAFSLILLAALSRFLPHPPNMVPITALALFSGTYLEKRYAILVPLAAMLVSDYFLGYNWGTSWVYVSFALIGLIGLWLRGHRGLLTTAAATVTGSVVFYFVSNFGVWISSGMYPLTTSGLAECYVNAIPFFRNTLIGDGLYVGVMFGLFELGKKFVPSLGHKISVN